MAIVAGSVDVEVVGTDDRCVGERCVWSPRKAGRYYIVIPRTGGFCCEDFREVFESFYSRGVEAFRICTGKVMGGGSQKAPGRGSEWV